MKKGNNFPVLVALRMTQVQYDDLKASAVKKGCSIASLIRSAINLYEGD